MNQWVWISRTEPEKHVQSNDEISSAEFRTGAVRCSCMGQGVTVYISTSREPLPFISSGALVPCQMTSYEISQVFKCVLLGKYFLCPTLELKMYFSHHRKKR